MAGKSKNPAAVRLGKLSGEARRRNGYSGGFAAMKKSRVKELSARGVAARKKSRRQS